MAQNNAQSQKRAIAYSFLAHIRNSGTFVDGPLDIFIPIVKNALAELYPNGAVKGAALSEITEKIKESFGLDIPTPVMHNIMKKIADTVNTSSGKQEITIFNDGAFTIEKFIFEEYKEQIQSSKDEVGKVLKLFREFCSIYKLGDTVKESDLIGFIEQNQADISYYLSHEPQKENCTNTIVAQFVTMFRNAPQVYETLRNIYLGSMLTSYLTYQPQNVTMGVELLLDTNFIVSLLDLNTPESTKTCSTFIETSKSLGYTFTVLKDTIEEFQSLLSYKAQNLNQAIVAKYINKEDIYNACDRRNLNRVDLERIADNIEETLTQQFGFRIIPHTEKLKRKARYSNEYNSFKKVRTTEKSALHDAMAVQYVKEKRGNKPIYDFDKVNCWFVNNAISHCNEHIEQLERLQKDNIAQPEIIKVDDLLNIIWLSNPSSSFANTDFVDMGITSMVSYNLNSTLPKARIIKELDENIRKYRNDNTITDKDVVRLSTRIVQRQIDDVQALNDLAKKDGAQFAAKVKEEAIKQEQIDNERALKLDTLMKSMAKGIEELHQNKERLDRKHHEKMIDLKEQELALREKSNRLIIGEQASNRQLHNAWIRENKHRIGKWKDYQNEKFNKKKKLWKRTFWGTIVFLVMAISLCIFVFDKEAVYRFISDNSPWSILCSLFVLCFSGIVVKNYSEWCYNPNYEERFKNNLNRLPEMKEISYDDFLRELQKQD